MTSVAIVGAGVSGLTCGVELQKAGFDVTLYARELERTTSSIAAAIWYPYDIRHPNAIAWALETCLVFEQLASDPATGVSMVWFEVRGEPREAWVETLEWRDVDDGYAVRVPLIETPVYLPWLRRGLRIEQRTVTRFDELTEDLIVNCAGLGARELCGDRELRAGRGVVLRAPYAGPPIHVVDERTLTYVLTRRDDVILGGTNDDREDEDVANAASEIAKRCGAFLDVRDAQPLVGFRPIRPNVRLEREGNVIHDYGHGGAGFTVSWACAREVVRMAG